MNISASTLKVTGQAIFPKGTSSELIANSFQGLRYITRGGNVPLTGIPITPSHSVYYFESWIPHRWYGFIVKSEFGISLVSPIAINFVKKGLDAKNIMYSSPEEEAAWNPNQSERIY